MADKNKGMRGSGGPKRRAKKQQLKDAKARQAGANIGYGDFIAGPPAEEPESYGYRAYDIPEEVIGTGLNKRGLSPRQKASGGTVRRASGGPVVDSYDYD